MIFAYKVMIPLLFASLFSFGLQGAHIAVRDLKCEYKTNPLGVDIRQPRFSWILKSTRHGVVQTAYQVFVCKTLEELEEGKANVWDSKKVLSDQSIQIFYGGIPLESNKKYFWKVRVWDGEGNTFDSEPAFWTTGLFADTDWKAKWIGLDRAVGDDDPDAPHRKLSARMLRHEFKVKKKIKTATAFISGLGLFELYLNGQKIGDQVLAPALTEYDKRTFYMTFDITENLLINDNAIGVILGNGRYFAPRGDEPTKTRTFGYPKVICQIELEYEDGTAETIITDESWKLTTGGPIRKNNEYDGEYYDARMELSGWNEPGYDDSKWLHAASVDKPGKLLVGQPNEPIRIIEEVMPIEVNEIKPGVFVFDMGQNMVGWVELFVNGNRGDRVTMRFAETLKDDGGLFLDNIRGAEVTDTYVLKGGGEEYWEPRFTYHGFRYVEITGYPGTPDLSAITGKVIHDALEVTGSFSCSNPLIDNIYKNAYWGIRGNYRSIPTDCPQRDERQGWLGDRSAECTGESYIFNIASLYNKWITDMRDAQLENGSIPDVAPSYWPIYSDNTTWPGTFLFASDMLYTQYGDLKVIEDNYPAMQKWISHMSGFLWEGLMPKDTYGDWCVPPEDLSLIHTSDPLRTTSAEYIGTAYFHQELKMMAKFAGLLGREEDAAGYLKKAAEIKETFNNRFLDKYEVRYSNNSNTANILALAFGLVPPQYTKKITDNLLQKILGEGGIHVGNGIIGGQWLMRTLTSNGHADVAYTLAAQDTYPSWGYMVRQGATTIWELWNGDKGDPAMNSGNHVMLLGDLIIWFYENLAGIKADPDLPAFKHIIMKPVTPPGLSHVTASYRSAYGTIKSSWKLEEGRFIWNISIPANTTASIYVPTPDGEDVMEGDQLAAGADQIKFIDREGRYSVFEAGSGNYVFSSNGAKTAITKPYVSTPVIVPAETTGMVGDEIRVTVACEDDEAVIRYTLDGSLPDSTSPVYGQPLKITKSAVLNVQAFRKGYNPSVLTTLHYDFVDPLNNGVRWSLFEGTFKKIPDFNLLTAAARGKVFQVGLDKISVPDQNFALRFDGFIQIDRGGKYTFYTTSNDGSKLYIDGKLVVENDGEHGTKQLGGAIDLDEGRHSIRIEYFQSGGSKNLEIYYRSDEMEYQPVPGSILFLKDE